MFKKDTRKRIVEIDFLRGFAIFMMMIDHFFFDFLPGSVAQTFFPAFRGQLISFAQWYWSNPIRWGIRFFFLGLFLLISGISCYFSRNNLKRGAVVFILGLLINAGFAIYAYCLQSTRDPLRIIIIFGPINCYGTCMLLYWLIKFLYDKAFPDNKSDFKWLLLTLGMAIFGIGIMFGIWNINSYYTTRGSVELKYFFHYIIGSVWHNSSDWMPLCPYFGIFLFGAFIGEVFYSEKKSYIKPLPTSEECNRVVYYGAIMPYKGFKNTICYIGKKSMWFYILHQPAIILCWAIVLLCMGYQLKLPI